MTLSSGIIFDCRKLWKPITPRPTERSRLALYFARAISAEVTFGKGPHDVGFRCDIVVHVMKGLVLKGSHQAQEAHPAFDGAAGQWRIITADGAEDVIRVPWPGGEITERREVRREIVALYDEACARLGVTPRPHA